MHLFQTPFKYRPPGQHVRHHLEKKMQNILNEYGTAKELAVMVN